MTTVTIASLEIKEKRSIAITTDGRRLGFWQSEAAKLNLQIGGIYEVEITEKNVDGRVLTNIVKAKQVAAASFTTPPPTKGEGGNHYRPTCPQDAERMFVCSLLRAFIQAGKIEPELNRVVTATNVLRTAWNKTFGGNDGTFTSSDAGRYHMEAAE